MQFAGKAEKQFEPLGSLIRHWKKIAVIGVLTFIALLPLVKLKSKVHFEAEGKIRVEPVITSALIGAKNSITDRYGSFVGTEIFKIHSAEIVRQALAELPANLQKKLALPDPANERALAVLMRNMKVERIHDTHLIRILILGSKPDGLAELVNAIIAAYLRTIQSEAESKGNSQLAYLEGEKTRLDEEIAVQTHKLHEIANKAGMSTFSEQFNPLNRQLGDLQEAFTRAYGARVEKENVLGSVQKEIVHLKKISLDALVEEMVEKDQSLWDLGFWTYKTMQEMRASLDGMTFDNPDRKYVEERMKGMSKHLKKLRGDVRKRADKVVHSKRDYELQTKLIRTRSEFEATKKAESEMRKELEMVKKQAAEVSRQILLGQETETELRRLNKQHIEISERVYRLQAEVRAPGRVFLESYARTPYEPVSSNLKKILAAVSVFSFGWITFAALLFDAFDNRIRSTKDLETSLGFAPTWPISHLKKAVFARATLDAPESTTAKAIRSLAVRLNSEREKHQAKTVVFIGIDQHSGVSEILLNTAHAVRGICDKVLILELNLTTPKLAQICSIPAGIPGLKGMLEGKSLSGSISHDADRNIDVLAAIGKIEAENAKIAKVLGAAKQEYNFVLIDTAPVLKNDLTEFLMLKADTGVLVVHGDRSLYRNVRHAVEILSKLELKSLAVVLNWMHPKQLSKKWTKK